MNEIKVALIGLDTNHAIEFARRMHAPGASPFARFEPWPARGYRAQDFPKTESLVHRFVAVPLGVPYTDEDADDIGAAIGRTHEELAG